MSDEQDPRSDWDQALQMNSWCGNVRTAWATTSSWNRSLLRMCSAIPWISPLRMGRVVVETEKASRGSDAINLSMTVLLPAPLGPVIRTIMVPSPPLLQVHHLLAQGLDLSAQAQVVAPDLLLAVLQGAQQLDGPQPESAFQDLIDELTMTPADALRAALDDGVPFAVAAQDLASLGVEMPDPLPSLARGRTLLGMNCAMPCAPRGRPWSSMMEKSSWFQASPYSGVLSVV